MSTDDLAALRIEAGQLLHAAHVNNWRTTMSDCKHRKLQTWHFEDDGIPAGMWSCVDCGHRFVPVNLPQEKDAERYRVIRQDHESKVLPDLALYAGRALDEYIDAAIDRMRVLVPPNVQIDLETTR